MMKFVLLKKSWMPDYKYKCDVCDGFFIETLPISFSPETKIQCQCGGMASRRIMGPTFIMNKPNTLGKWYKKETGKELMD